MSVTKDNGDVFAKMVDAGLAHNKAVRVFADCLAEYMEKIHGRPMRVNIDHEDGFVVVRPK